MKIHLLPDSIYSENFINFVNQKFHARQHLFYIFLENQESKYVKPQKNVRYWNENSLKNILLSKKNHRITKKVEAVFIHYLTAQKVAYIYKYFLKTEADIYWCIWGGDYYSFQTIELYDEETITFQKEKDKTYQSLKGIIQKEVYQYILNKVFQRLDYVSILAEHGTGNIKLKPDVKYIETLYPLGNKIEIAKEQKEPEILKILKKYSYKILIGNSGSLTNNHLAILRKLSYTLNADVALIVPLSYGEPEYISYVLKEGKRLFGKRFIPLTEFYPVTEYNQILQNIDVAIWNHKVSEGFGNIRLLLEFGKKIFYRKTPWSEYQRLDRIGITYEDTNEIEHLTSEEICRPYPEEINQKNRENILRFSSDQHVYELWDKVFNKKH